MFTCYKREKGGKALSNNEYPLGVQEVGEYAKMNAANKVSLCFSLPTDSEA